MDSIPFDAEYDSESDQLALLLLEDFDSDDEDRVHVVGGIL